MAIHSCIECRGREPDIANTELRTQTHRPLSWGVAGYREAIAECSLPGAGHLQAAWTPKVALTRKRVDN